MNTENSIYPQSYPPSKEKDNSLTPLLIGGGSLALAGGSFALLNKKKGGKDKDKKKDGAANKSPKKYEDYEKHTKKVANTIGEVAPKKIQEKLDKLESEINELVNNAGDADKIEILRKRKANLEKAKSRLLALKENSIFKKAISNKEPVILPIFVKTPSPDSRVQYPKYNNYSTIKNHLNEFLERAKPNSKGVANPKALEALIEYRKIMGQFLPSGSFNFGKNINSLNFTRRFLSM